MQKEINQLKESFRVVKVKNKKSFNPTRGADGVFENTKNQ